MKPSNANRVRERVANLLREVSTTSRSLLPVIVLLTAILSVTYLLIDGVAFLSTLQYLGTTLDQLGPVIALLLVALSVLTTASLLQSSLRSRELAIAYSVAIIGFPGSGKTTLITALFKEVFDRRVKKYDIRVASTSTIDRVNRDIAQLEQGFALASTKDSDVFAYRADVRISSPLGRRRLYQLQIGDFPGEDTEVYLSPENKEWLHKSSFFAWADTADAVIFVIDLAKYLEVKEYPSQVSAAIRAAWQQMAVRNKNEIRRIQDKPVTLVFNKVDLQLSDVSLSIWKKNKANVDVENYRAIVPERQLVSDSDGALVSLKHDLLLSFRGLIEFLEADTHRFKVIFASSFATNATTGVALGVSELLDAILPT